MLVGKLVGTAKNSYIFAIQPNIFFMNVTHVFLLISFLTILGHNSLRAQPAIEWERCVGYSNTEGMKRFAMTSDNGFLLAGTSASCVDSTASFIPHDILVTKLDSLLTVEWSICLGGSDEEEVAFVDETSDGGCIVIGWTESTDGNVIGNHGQKDIWVIKLDSIGNIDWQKCIGGSGSDEPANARRTDFGYIIVGMSGSNDGDITGHYANTWLHDGLVIEIDALGNILRQKCYGGSNIDRIYSVENSLNGGYVFAGTTSSSDGDVTHNIGQTDVWILEVDSLSQIVWSETYGGGLSEEAMEIRRETDGSYIVGGHTSSIDGDFISSNGGQDIFVMEIDPTGDIVWERCIGRSSTDDIKTLYLPIGGGVVLAGRFLGSQSCNGFSHSYFITKLDDYGFIQWEKCLGGNSSIWMINQGADGSYFTGGATSNPSCTHGNYDMWLAKRYPERDLNLITGRVFIDNNTDCNYDSTETLLAGRIVQALPGPHYATTDLNGNYRLWVDTGVHVVTLAPHPYWATDCPANYHHTVNFFNSGMTIDSINFSSYIYNYCANLQVGVGTALQRRCFNYNQVAASVCNTGTITADSVVLTLHFPTGIIPRSASTAWTGGVNGIYHFQVGDLQPGQCFQVNITDSVSCDVNLGDVLCIYVDATHQSNDCNTVSTFTSTHHCETIIGAFDPNDKQVASQNFQQEGYLFEGAFMQDDTLTYRIRFQNTGNDTAFTVIVKDTISPWLDPATIVTEVTSHDYTYRLYGQGIAEWRFDNILLPDSFVNEPLSHGFIKYHILPRQGIPYGTQVHNSAAIYFDYNEPVITNQTTSILGSIITNEESVYHGQGIKLYPNPATNEVVIETQNESNTYGLFDISGRQVMSGSANTNKFTLGIGNLSKGVYFIQVSGGNKTVYGKLVKE